MSVRVQISPRGVKTASGNSGSRGSSYPFPVVLALRDFGGWEISLGSTPSVLAWLVGVMGSVPNYPPEQVALLAD